MRQGDKDSEGERGRRGEELTSAVVLWWGRRCHQCFHRILIVCIGLCVRALESSQDKGGSEKEEMEDGDQKKGMEDGDGDGDGGVCMPFW